MAADIVDLRERIKPISAIAEAEEELRLKMLRDAKLAWNSLVGLAGYAVDERIQIEAQKTVLAYTIGLPVERHEIDDKRKDRAAGPLDVARMSDAELEAVKTLREAAKARALDEDGEE